jgi:hypothetical protein
MNVESTGKEKSTPDVGVVESCLISAPCESVRLVVATLAVFALVAVVIAGVAFTYCALKIHPAANFLIMLFCLTLLAYIEALHYAAVINPSICF